jgi:GTP cyclohydrolase II
MYDTGNDKIRLVSFGNVESFKESDKSPLVRIHSSCIASEVFKSQDCDCADQLEQALVHIHEEKQGLVFHLEQEGRGHGLSKKIRAVQIGQTMKLDTVEAFDYLGLEQDIRTYQDVVDILKDLGITRIRLMSNNFRKKEFIEAHGVIVDEQINTTPIIRNENREYLFTKNKKLLHSIPL